MKQDFQVISKAFKNQFILPKFDEFCVSIDRIYEECRDITAGNVASYIPQLAGYDPNYWGVSICTVDGQGLFINNDITSKRREYQKD